MPRTDVCSTCVDIANKIAAKKREGKKEEYHALKVQLKLHRMRATRFYQELKASKNKCNVLCVTFDLQKNLCLPKLNVTEAYYSRQLWLYNLGIVIHDVYQSKRNIFFYTWLESQGGRGSNEIISALSNFLRRIHKRIQRRGYKKLALFSDSCAGQNKNATMIAYLLKYVNSKMNVFREVSFTFPIRGHSYMPPDRVFGRVEKEIRRKECIASPEGYYEIMQRHGRLHKLGKKWQVYDYKTVAVQSLKSMKDVQIRSNRIWRFVKNCDSVLVSNTYSGNPTIHKLLREPMQQFVRRYPVQLPQTTHVSAAK